MRSNRQPNRVNIGLRQAPDKIILERSTLEAREGIPLHTLLREFTFVSTSPDMLTEASESCKNAMEQSGEGRENRTDGIVDRELFSHNSAVECLIRDTGIGINLKT